MGQYKNGGGIPTSHSAIQAEGQRVAVTQPSLSPAY